MANARNDSKSQMSTITVNIVNSGGKGQGPAGNRSDHVVTQSSYRTIGAATTNAKSSHSGVKFSNVADEQQQFR